MVDPQRLLPFPTHEEIVVTADVTDPNWWLLSLAAPFTAIVYSPPCPPWSRGGTKPGFSNQEGTLLAHSLGLILLFGVDTAIGENVDGLVDHPHWPRVVALLEAAGLRYEVVLNDLADVGYMSRKRCFILSGSKLHTPLWTKSHVSWQNAGAILRTIPNKASVELPLDQNSPFCQTRFLPSDKRMQAHNLGVQDGPAVVRMRTCEAMTLPTLVASYRFQDQLDLAHLLKKGIFTWFVPDQAFAFGARFMHAFEAARCLGFRTDFWLPVDQVFAMHLLGNAVSPVQALWALSHMFPSTQDPLELAHLFLFGQIPLTAVCLVTCQEHMYLVQELSIGRPHFLGHDLCCITCDGTLFPLPLALVQSQVRATCSLPLAPPWNILEVGRWLQEDALMVLVRVTPLQVKLAGITLLLSPFASLECLNPLLVAHVPQPREVLPIWTWFNSDRLELDYSDEVLAAPSHVFLTAGTAVRTIPHCPGETIAQHAQRAFPHCASALALATLPDGQVCAPSDSPHSGQSLQCQFYPQRIWIEPYGQFTLDPVSRAGEVANMLSIQYFAGRASVRLTCNGRLIPSEVPICSANTHGVLRARVFALPGGAPSLAAQMENLQTLLVQHGHPASTSKAKSDEIFNKLGQTKLKVIAESKTPWIQLKAEASARKIVLIPPEHRGQAKSSEDPLLANDPWTAGRNRDSKTTKKKQAPKPPPSKVADEAGSYRGLSRGVAVASKFPIFSPRPSQVPPLAWQSQRLLCTVVQMGQVPLHVVTVYLHPNPTPGSFRHRLNSQLLDWAWAILSEVSGPACLVGDFNSPWESYDVGEALVAKGWVDLHAFWAEQKGQIPQPTCKQATRHTFVLGNPAFRPFVTDVTVDFEDSLDSHSVLLAKISCPTCNPLVWKWLLPQSLDQCSFDPLLSQEAPDQAWLDEFQPLLQAGDLSKAFQHWSQSAEQVLVRAARLNDAPVQARRFSGRAQQLHPVRRTLAAPRFKQGRSSDFCVEHHANTLIVRQVQRQARRLQNLGRLLRSPVRPVTHTKISELWQAILSSTGFGRSFPNWLLSQVDFVHLTPTVACVETATQVVLAHANRLASQSWRARRKHFSDCLEASWTSDGGRLPFKMVRESPLPPVQELEMVIPLVLAPQQWSPIGKAWIPFVNVDAIPIGAELEWSSGRCRVMDKVGNSLQVSARLTRREASQLVYRKVSLDPNEWAPFFLTQWDQFWQRDQDDDDQVPQPLLDALPTVPPMDSFALDFSDWRQAVNAAKTHTMRGVDGWSAAELKALPEGWVLPLLRLFDAIAAQGHWPRQLSIWLLILLRKTDASVADWSTLRPISVASLTYRVWSRMCTFHMMKHARRLALPFVAPHLSTRSIWGWLAERIACQYRQRSTMSGLVLDIVKCFNVLPRCILFAIMRRLGFDGPTLSVWALQLSGLERTLYIDTCVYGSSVSSTGVPEGDPLSVVAMFSMSLAFAFYLSVHSPLLPMAFADNWEALSVSSQELLQALPTVETFLGLCRLPVSVSKCWVWAITKSERKALKQARLNDAPLPVKLQAKELGVDIAYSLRRVARCRNQRVKKGIGRLARLGSLPAPVWRKTRLLLSSVYPCALHGAETSFVPKSVLQRLRAKASKAVFGSHKGSSPWLACLLGTYRCIDPQLTLLMNRIALFRQVAKEMPSQVSFLIAQLARTGRYRGPTSRLVTVLADLGWIHQAEGVFVDLTGRTFHLVLTPMAHVESLLLSSWTQEVASRTSHRKYLEALENIDVTLSTRFQHLPMSERALLQRQHSGAFFTGEFLKHTGGSDQCRFCHQSDTRMHRLLHCPRVQPLFASFPLLVRNQDAIPRHTWAHGLWDEPPLWRPWQALLDSLTLPEIARSDCVSAAYLYSDGACLRPKCSHASLAAAAVVKAAPDGSFEIVWSGRLPGSLQTPFRSELLAGAVAFASYREVHLFSDCLAFVKVARRLLLAAQRGQDPVFPSTHLDLWTFFWVSLQGTTAANCAITWVPSHRDYRKLSGMERVHAWFNGCADKVARESARLAICPLFRDLVAQVDLLNQAATQLASYQAGVAKIFANEKIEPPACDPILPGDLLPQAAVRVPSEVVLDFSSVPCPSFARQLLQWLLSLRWTPSAVDPVSRQIWSDTSFLELFWAFVWSTGVLPPFRHDGAWVLPQDDPLLIFVQPSFCVLFRSWKRQLDILVRLGFIPCWAASLAVTASAGSLGATFPCPGVVGRALVPLESLLSLAAALRCARRLSALALPITVN
eukprot:Skav235098  [mRNA]  locus=scaffold711:123242:131735:- [translate_table: standard]